MGGKGSTRWNDHQRAPLIEHARELSVAAIKPALERSPVTGVLRWTDPGTEEVTAEFVFSIGPVSEGGSRRLLIEPTDGGRKQSVLLEPVRLGWYSGLLFACPADCGRRSRRLFARPPWESFLCRRCAGLVYRSSQQHDARVDQALRDPWAFQMTRSRAPETSHSRLVTARLTFTALERATKPRKGRSWGRIARSG
jgi:hypothetical protein